MNESLVKKNRACLTVRFENKVNYYVSKLMNSEGVQGIQV